MTACGANHICAIRPPFGLRQSVRPWVFARCAVRRIILPGSRSGATREGGDYAGPCPDRVGGERADGAGRAAGGWRSAALGAAGRLLPDPREAPDQAWGAVARPDLQHPLPLLLLS